MKLEQMRNLSVDELKKNLEQAHQDQMNLRIKHSTRQLVNHRELPRLRHEIAQLNTIIREKELTAEVTDAKTS
jgi:large subunit ribosomal protein L29